MSTLSRSAHLSLYIIILISGLFSPCVRCQEGDREERKPWRSRLEGAPKGAFPLLDWRHRIVGHIYRVPPAEGQRLSSAIEVVPDGKEPFRLNYLLGGFVSGDGSRILMAGQNQDGLVGARGGVALLYDGDGKLIRQLAKIESPWMSPIQPLFAMARDGSSWVADGGNLLRFDADGLKTMEKGLPNGMFPRLLRLSKAGDRALLVMDELSDMAQGRQGVLLVGKDGEVLGKAVLAGDALDWLNSDVDFATENLFVAVDISAWCAFRITATGVEQIVRGTHTCLNIVRPFSISAAPDRFATVVFDGADPDVKTVVVTVREIPGGKTLLEKKYTSPEGLHLGSCTWRALEFRGDLLEVDLPWVTDTIDLAGESGE